MNRSTSLAASAQVRTEVVADDVTKTRYLYWWLLLSLFLEYARPGTLVPPIEAMKLNSLVPLSLLVVTFFAKGLRPFSEIFRDAMARWMVFYVVLMAFSIVTALVQLYSWQLFQDSLGYFFLFIIIVRVVTTERRVLGVYTTLVLAHLFLVAANPSLILSPESRVYIQGGTFLGDGNDFSLSVCILLGPAIYVALNEPSRFRQLIYWIFVGVLLLCVIGTQSRGGTLAAGAALVLMWYGSERKLLGLMGLAAVVLVVVVYAPDAYFERMNTIANYQSEGSAQGRLTAWGAGIRMALDNPVFGVGTANFPTAFGSTYGRLEPGMPWLTAHSMYFLVLGELGFPGIVTLFVLLFGTFFATMWLRARLLQPRQSNPPPGHRRRAQLLLMLACSQIAFIVGGAFLSVAYYPHIFVVTGLLLGARAITRKDVAFVDTEKRTRQVRIGVRADRPGATSSRGRS